MTHLPQISYVSPQRVGGHQVTEAEWIVFLQKSVIPASIRAILVAADEFPRFGFTGWLCSRPPGSG
jgi:hypothetical protein